MSDGLTDASNNAHNKAVQFALEHYPGVTHIGNPRNAPAKGTVILIYEDWLDHIIEVITDRVVVAAFKTMFGKDVGALPLPDNMPVQGSQYYKLRH